MTKRQWNVLTTGPASAQIIMSRDRLFLENLALDSHAPPLLHLYEWEKPSATYGHFLNPWSLLHAGKLASSGVELARRPTGGGLIFHVTDLAFSMIIPASYPAYSVNTLDNYAYVNALVIHALTIFCGKNSGFSLLPTDLPLADKTTAHFCMAQPTKYDVMLDGRKVGGGAQRRTKYGLLHQGTLSISQPNEELLRPLLLAPKVMDAMQAHTQTLLPENLTAKQLADVRHQLSRILRQIVEEGL